MNISNAADKSFCPPSGALSDGGERGVVFAEVVTESHASSNGVCKPAADEFSDEEAEAFFFV